MQFKGDLDAATYRRVEACNFALHAPERLAILRKTRLMGSQREEAFDRLAYLAAKYLNVPLTIISLVDSDTQFFKAGFGLPAPYDELREIPIETSICRYTLQNQEIIAADSSLDPLLKVHPTTEPWGIGAFIAIPMRTEDGHVLGAFCAVDSKVKQWTEDEVQFLRELTNSVMTEITLRLKIAELEEEIELREKFVIALSHDLRNPLSVAKMGVALMNENDGSEDREMVAKIICDNIDRADTMIQELLSASRIKAGEKIPLNMKFGDLVQIVSSTIDSLRRLHRREFVFETRGQIQGMWDFDRIRRMVENLAGNAVKYGDADKFVTISIESVSNGYDITVHNWGKPIPAEDTRDLFDLFKRSDSVAFGSQKGWGIGLSVVKALAEDLNGEVSVSSDEEKGTIFTVHLPLMKPTKG